MGKSVLHAVTRGARSSSERKRMVKLCVRKLQSIEDPETFLCRSVLINNTLKSLQVLQREAKLRKEREALRRRQLEQEQEQEQDIGEEEEEEEDQEEEIREELPAPARLYTAEDILSNIDMPAPLSPTLEDLNPIPENTPLPLTSLPPSTPPLSTAPLSSLSSPSPLPSLPCSVHNTTTASPLLSSNSSLSSGWIDRDSLDWEGAPTNHLPSASWEAEQPASAWERPAWDKWSNEESSLWERGNGGGQVGGGAAATAGVGMTATLDLTLIKDTPVSSASSDEDTRSDSSSSSGEEASSSGSEGDLFDREVSCSHSYIAEQSGGLGVINSLIASLES